MHLDALLHATHQSLPKNLHEKPMGKSIMDSPEAIIRCLQVVLLLERARCTLHYRYLAPSRSDERYAYSRNTCIAAALHILEYHHLVEQEGQPGGRLSSKRWKVDTPILRDYFFLAATLLCLELDVDISSNILKKLPLPENMKGRMIQGLQKSYSIWKRSGTCQTERKRHSRRWV